MRKSGNNDSRRCEYNELNASEPMKRSRKGKRRCQKQMSTCGLRRVYRTPDYRVHDIRDKEGWLITKKQNHSQSVEWWFGSYFPQSVKRVAIPKKLVINTNKGKINLTNMSCLLTHIATIQVISLCKLVISIFSNFDLCTTNFRLEKGWDLYFRRR